MTPHQTSTLSVVRELSVLGGLLVTASVLAVTGHPELAATALGGALGVAIPGTRHAPVPALVFGLGAGAIAGSVAWAS